MAPLTEADARRLAGRRIIVTAGGTREPIDPVRYLGNRSSGKMGNALARVARDAGAAVTLITAAAPPVGTSGIDIIEVGTAAEMHAVVSDRLAGAAALIMAAAVADYRPVQVSSSKIKKRPGAWLLELEPTVDILRSLRHRPERDGVLVVGFAAETSDLLPNAQAKLHEKSLDLIVLNDVARHDIAMGADANEVTIIDADGVVAHVARAPKDDVAAAILSVVATRLR
ncbi:MAG: phosphopantothenoylcysteine decarboxylase [Candidatus Dormibacteria bacterium]